MAFSLDAETEHMEGMEGRRFLLEKSERWLQNQCSDSEKGILQFLT